MSAPHGWAIPEAVADPGWSQRPARPRLGLLVVGVLLVAAVCAAGVFAVTSWPSAGRAPGSPAPAIVGVTISSDPPSRPAVAGRPAGAATPRLTTRPARPAPVTPTRSYSQSRPGGTPRPTVTAQRPAPTGPSSTPVSTRPAGGSPIPVTQTASQSIACDAGTTVTATGSADRPGTLTLTGGGTRRTATGSRASASMPATTSATYTASMRGINPHVAVSCS